ncbi:hypothetical protein BC936DRAFT_142567, partial [Jimgerdemannia flammicorona]
MGLLFSSFMPVLLCATRNSMGGSVVTDVAHKQLLKPFHVLGLAVLDVVEGSAMEALSSMLSYLRTRPTQFRSLEQAIEW